MLTESEEGPCPILLAAETVILYTSEGGTQTEEGILTV